MILITGIVGLLILFAFLGTMAWWIREVPFTIIVVGVLILLLYDFFQDLRSERRGPER